MSSSHNPPEPSSLASEPLSGEQTNDPILLESGGPLLPSGGPQSLPLPRPIEDPPWGIVDVIALAVVTVLTIVLAMLGVSLLAHRYVAPATPWIDLARRPEVVVVSQVLAYALILALMLRLAGTKGGQPASALRWNWPRQWPLFLWYGVLLSIGLQIFARVLPMPKKLPIDEFFQTPREAWLLSLFGITFAPLIEELFFRGFLYPVLARHLNLPLAIVLTGLAFGAIHGAQLMYAWGPVLVIVLVGIALTAVRARTRSVASTVLMHIGYNFTITAAMYIATDGFRHLEKLKQ